MAKGRRRSSLKEAPDGGYGWVVLVACAICLSMVISTGRIGGLVFVEIINFYKVSRTEAMTVLIVGRMFAFIAAPVAGKLLTRFDFSFIMCIGGLIMSTALILSFYATAAWQLIITYGCIMGTGSDFILVSSTLVVGIYFKKRRSLAMGMLYAIACSGGFIMPPLFNFLLEHYQFHGALLIVGAITLNAAACGLLVRQPTWTNKGNSAVKDYEFRPATTNSNENLYQSGTIVKPRPGSLLVQRSQSRISTGTVESKTAEEPNGRPKSSVDAETGMRNQYEYGDGLKEKCVPAIPPMLTDFKLPEIREIPNECAEKNRMLEKEPFLPTPAESKPNITEHPNPIRSLFHQFVGSLKIFTDYLFILMFINRVFVMSCLLNFNPIVPDYVEKDMDANISKQEVAFILSMMAVGDVIGRLAIGYMLDKLPWPKKHSFGGLSVLLGILLFTLHWANSYASLLAINVVYGFLMGSSVIVQYVLEVDLMGAQRAPAAHTISQFSIGIVATVGGFIVGYMRDSLGSYTQSINLLAGVSVASGLVWALEPIMSKILPPPPAPLVKSVTTASIIEPEEPHI